METEESDIAAVNEKYDSNLWFT